MTNPRPVATPRSHTLTIRLTSKELTNAQKLAQRTDQSIARLFRMLLAEAVGRASMPEASAAVKTVRR